MIRVQSAVTQLLLREPFYGALALRLKIVEDPTIKTFRTNGLWLRFNPTYAATLRDAEIRSVIAHEIIHILGGHLWRVPVAGDLDTWNIAADHETNLILAGVNTAAQAVGEPDPFPLKKEWYCDSRFKGQAVEAIYWTLQARQKEEGKSQKNQTQQGNAPPQTGQPGQCGVGQASSPAGQAGVPPPPGQPGQGPGAQPQSGNGNPHSAIRIPQSSAPPSPSPSSRPSRDPLSSPGDFVPPTDDQKKLEKDWQMATLAAAKAAQGRGHLPAGMDRLVDQIKEPKVPWMAHARAWLDRVSYDNWNWMRPNHHYDGTGFILPTLHSQKVGKIVFVKDTSGSIGAELLAQFHGEAQGALDELHPVALVDMCCDARVKHEREYTPGETIDPVCQGGGGTDFAPVFERIAEWDEPPVALVYLTDLDGTFPDTPPDYPVLWVAWGRRDTAPFGDVVKANDD